MLDVNLPLLLLLLLGLVHLRGNPPVQSSVKQLQSMEAPETDNGGPLTQRVTRLFADLWACLLSDFSRELGIRDVSYLSRSRNSLI